MASPNLSKNGTNDTTPLESTTFTLLTTAEHPTEAVRAASPALAAASSSSLRRKSVSPDPSSSSAAISDSFVSVAEEPQQPPPASLEDVDAAGGNRTSHFSVSPDTSDSQLSVFTGRESASHSPPSIGRNGTTARVQEEEGENKRETRPSCPNAVPESGAIASSAVLPAESSSSPAEHPHVLNRATLERLASGDGSLVTVEVLAAFAPLYTRSGAQVFADLASQNRKLFFFFKTLKAESVAWESLAGSTGERAVTEQKGPGDPSADDEWENDNNEEWESTSVAHAEDQIENEDVFSESRLLWSKLPKLRQSKVKERVFAVAATLLHQLASAEVAACATESNDGIEQPLDNVTHTKAHNHSPFPGHSDRTSTATETHHRPPVPATAVGPSRITAGLFTEHFDWNQLTPALQAIYDYQGHRQEVIDGKTFWTFITRCTLNPLKNTSSQPGPPQASVPAPQPPLKEGPSRPARLLEVSDDQGPVIEEVGADGPWNRSALASQHSQKSNVINQDAEEESDDEDEEDGPYNTEQLQELMEALLKNMSSRPDEAKREGECEDGTEDPEEEKRIQAFTQLLLMQMGIHADGEGPVAHGPIDEETERELKLRHLVQERRRDPARQHLADMWEELLREDGDKGDPGQDGLETNTGDGQRYAFGARSYTGLGLREKFRSLKRRFRERRLQNEAGCHRPLNDENYQSETAL